MKKMTFWLIGATVALTACEKAADTEVVPDNTKRVTFKVTGDFESSAFARTRALDADGKTMTDLWLLDYMDGSLVQQLHKTSEDADFESPSMLLDFGNHHVYFVASRGTTPTLSTDAHKITWTSTSDTFWQDYSVAVTSGTSGAHAVTLGRVATKLGITIADEIPTGTSYVQIIPSTWYYGIDYLTGLPTDAETDSPRTINIPLAMIGTTGTSLSIFGLSGATEWTTDVTVAAYDGDDNAIGQAAISAAPFVANRVTSYSGNLFSGAGSFGMNLNGTWNEPMEGTW